MLRLRTMMALLCVLFWSGIAFAGSQAVDPADTLPFAQIAQPEVAAGETCDLLAGHCGRGGYYPNYYRGNYGFYGGGYGGWGYGGVNVYRANYYPVVVPRYPVYRTYRYGGWGCY